MRFGLVKSIFQKVDTLFTGRGRVDEDLLEELEAALLQADVSVHVATRVLEDLRGAIRDNRLREAGEVRQHLEIALLSRLESVCGADDALAVPIEAPAVYLVIGVNGVGKTTTIGKLAHALQRDGKKVLLAAGDTFRAAAIEQIQIWADRTGCDLVRHREGSDPSAVIYDAIAAARARGADVVIADTAGRLHTRANLMEELKKVNRVVESALGRPADERLLVLDATTGQNAISQARTFQQTIALTGLILAKMDGTARGGSVISIVSELGLPVKFVGTGEKLANLEPFDAVEFVRALVA